MQTFQALPAPQDGVTRLSRSGYPDFPDKTKLRLI
jgi:hypothetical protein